MAALELKDIRKSYSTVSIVHGIDLSIDNGEFVVFVGPSGCGKSTLLRMVAGLEEITAGTLSIGGLDMTRVSPAERGVAMVFQSYALYPHMTVEENIGFGLKINGASKAETRERVLKAAKILQLESLLERKPKQLSGGQRQRVAIGRAIVRAPDVFLFDEPLSNLDAELRVQMRLEIARLHRDLGATMIYVTHDQVEAMTLADKIVVLRAGCIEQVGAPLELYENPANVFVAGFIGSPKMNFLKATVVDAQNGEITVSLNDHAGGQVRLISATGSAKPGDEVIFGVRPEHLAIGDTGDFETVVDVIEHLGASSYAYAQSGLSSTLTIETGGGKALKPGDKIKVAISPDSAFLFDPDTGRRL